MQRNFVTSFITFFSVLAHGTRGTKKVTKKAESEHEPLIGGPRYSE